MIYHANEHQKKAGVATLTSDKLDFKPQTIIRDEEGHYIITEEPIQQDLTIVNIYAPNMGATYYISQLMTKLKKHINDDTIIVGRGL